MKSKKSKVDIDEAPAFSSFEEFEKLSAADKEKVDQYYTRKIPHSETRPLNKAEREQFERIRRRGVGRPRIGQGAKVVAVTLEKGFLQEVDDYAKKRGMKRAEMITRGLRLLMEKSA